MEIHYRATDRNKYVVKADGKKLGVLSEKNPEITVARVEKIEIRECITGSGFIDAILYFFLAALYLLSGTCDDAKEVFGNDGFLFRATTGTKSDVYVYSPFRPTTEQPVFYAASVSGQVSVIVAIMTGAFLTLAGVGVSLCFAGGIGAITIGAFLMLFACVIFGLAAKRMLKYYKIARSILNDRIKSLESENDKYN